MTTTPLARGTRRTPRIPIAVGIALFMSLAGTGVASAGWSTNQIGATTTITSAATTMTVGGSGSLSTAYKFAGAASGSPTIIKAIAVANTGSTPLSYVLSLAGVAGNALAPSVGLTLWKSGGTTCGPTVPTTGTTTGTLAAPPALPTGTTTAAAGATFTLCAATRLLTTVAAAQGLSITPTISVTGFVGNWTTSDPDTAFTQSVYRVPEPASVTCTQGGGKGNPSIQIGWSAPVNSGTSGALTYRIVDSAVPANVLDGPMSTLSSTLKFNDLPAGTYTIYVQALESQYGTSSAGVPLQIARSPNGPSKTLTCS